VNYNLTGKIIADNKEFRFQDFILNDSFANQAKLEGSIRHKGFENFSLDLTLKPDKFLLFNTKQYDNDIFYGDIKTTGTITASGPVNNIKVTAQVTTDKGTEIVVPLNGAESVDESFFVIFTKTTDDSYISKPIQKSSSSGFSLDLNINVTPDGTIQIFLPGDAGKILATGYGNMSMKLDNNNNFGLYGNYAIEKGDFFLTIQQLDINLINKKLSLNKGSNIQFNGDPLNATMNVSATYEVQTSLENLSLSLDSAQTRKRIPVHCIIHMQDRLSDPLIYFSIAFPSIHDDNMKSIIFSKIDTTNYAEMTRQAFSLLLLGSFSSDDYGSISGSSFVTSSTISMLTNQINNWLSQMFKGIDIGINYRSGDQITSDEFDVFARKGMFNDRVVIDANVGSMMNNNVNNGQNSTLVIDATLEVKITNDGRWRFKAFNRSNANDISKVGTNEYGYTYGLGASYNRSFNTIKELFTRTKKKKSKEQTTE
jgi:hypothetical protein